MNCTFKPKILERKDQKSISDFLSGSMNHKRSRSSRSIQQFLTDQNNFVKSVNEKL